MLSFMHWFQPVSLYLFLNFHRLHKNIYWCFVQFILNMCLEFNLSYLMFCNIVMNPFFLTHIFWYIFSLLCYIPLCSLVFQSTNYFFFPDHKQCCNVFLQHECLACFTHLSYILRSIIAVSWCFYLYEAKLYS